MSIGKKFSKLLAKKVKHITTTSKIKHKWEYIHDEIGYNYRLPNLNAAIGCAQLENVENFVLDNSDSAFPTNKFSRAFRYPS